MKLRAENKGVMMSEYPHIISGVYVLRLEHGKFYVGASTDIHRRIDGHGTVWTKEHRPISVHDVFPAKHNIKELEREVTLMYMDMYGWENVRGAGWTQRDMDNKPRALRQSS